MHTQTKRHTHYSERTDRWTWGHTKGGERCGRENRKGEKVKDRAERCREEREVK